MTKISKKKIISLDRVLLAVFLLLAVPAASFASEKYNICVYDIDYNVTGASPESLAEIEREVIDTLSKHSGLNTVDKEALKEVIGKYSGGGKVEAAELAETAKFAGIDYLLLLSLSGEVMAASDKLDELFEQNNSRPLHLGLKILDITHDETAAEINSDLDNMLEVRMGIKKQIFDLDLKYQRGRVEKISDGKIAVDLGQDDGAVEGQKAAVYKAIQVKVGRIDLSARGEMIGRATVEKMTKDKTMMLMEGSPEVKVGDFVEISSAEQPVAVSAEEAAVVVSGRPQDGYVVVSAQKPFVSAENRIKVIAKKAEDGRVQSGMYGLGLGLVFVSLGSAASSRDSYYGSNYSSFYYLYGLGSGILGVMNLVTPSEIENSYNQAKTMPAATIAERTERERFSESVLKKTAANARQGRYIGAGVLSALGLATASNGLGLVYLGFGVASLFMPSDLEKNYEEYTADKAEFIRSQGEKSSLDAP
jgi:hypothetical protein